MREPCRSCPRKEIDFGGCRCQALALTGDARETDPVCYLSPHHDRVQKIAAVLSQGDEAAAEPAYDYRRMKSHAPAA
jgi:pyrroloquinoline quinone biosynthesis protein E